LAEGQPEDPNDPEWEFVIKWVVSHGQSFEWTFSGDPRHMIIIGMQDADALQHGQAPAAIGAKGAVMKAIRSSLS
jgi:hypothetical protein